MILKEVPKRKGKSSFTRLVTYLTDPQGNPNRVLHVQATNLENDHVQDDLGLSCALTEVAELQSRNRRATEKTLHLMLSFHEDLDLATLRAVEHRVVEALGYGTHQRISVVHGDTTHQHLHVAINKVHCERGEDGMERYLNRHLEFSKRRLGSLAIELERDYGLVPDNHGLVRWDGDAQVDLVSKLRGPWVPCHGAGFDLERSDQRMRSARH